MASVRFHAGALRACSVPPAGARRGSQLVSPHLRPLLFSYLPFVFTQIPAAHSFILWYLPCPSCPPRGHSSVSFLSTCCASTYFGWVLWVNISTTLVTKSNLSPLIFIPSTDLTSILTVRMLFCFVGIRRDGERSHFTDLAFRSLAPPAMWGVDQHW